VNQVFGLAAMGATPISPGGLYQVLGQDFQVTLRALAEAGKLEVLSRPSILARNNQQAVITVGQSVPLPAASQIGANGQITTTINYQDVGIILRVTPFISADGLVEMIVAPEISTLTAQIVQISETVRSPVIARRYAETVVVTPHGQTVVIGGLMENNKTDTDRKIPLLGDIPVLGALFKRKIKENTKTELIIFLTPYVVADSTQLAEMTKSETDKSALRQGAFTDKELNRFLDALPLKDNPTPSPPPAQNGSKSNPKKNGTAPARGR
jgi:general secretion pathway protein D